MTDRDPADGRPARDAEDRDVAPARAALERLVAERTAEVSAAHDKLLAAEAANERLRELDRVKDAFLSDVTHELRTPLTNIKLYIGLLSSGRADRREHYMNVLAREAGRLESLVDNLLQLSRLDLARARGTCDRSDVDIAAVVDESTDSLAALAESLGVALEVHADGSSMHVWGDAEQLVRAVVNVVANALRYTPAGGSVSIDLHDECDWVTIVVADTGIGIRETDRGRVFDRFYRGADARKRYNEGTGLGLSIVKEIVDVHGGEVRIADNPPEGTVIAVRLPVAGEAGG